MFPPPFRGAGVRQGIEIGTNGGLAPRTERPYPLPAVAALDKSSMPQSLTHELHDAQGGQSARARGVHRIQEILRKAGVQGALHQCDGSGLSRKNLASPEVLGSILQVGSGPRVFWSVGFQVCFYTGCLSLKGCRVFPRSSPLVLVLACVG